jgi:hypothetical protein
LKNFKKKIMGAIMAAAMAITGVVAGGSTASAHHDTSGWQYVGQDYLVQSRDGWENPRTGHTRDYSGNLQLRFPDISVVSVCGGCEPVVEVQLWEYDPTNGDDHVKTLYFFPRDYTTTQYRTVDVSGFVDGTNGHAEVYAVYRSNFLGYSQHEALYYD